MILLFTQISKLFVRAKSWFWGMMVLLSFASCANKERLVVYADPWLEDYAVRITDEFKLSHPEVDVQLKVLSSEVIVQHLHFGQPIDVFLCFGHELFQDKDLKEKVIDQHRLADTRVVGVARKGDAFAEKQAAFGTVGCIVLEANERPLRRFRDQEFGGLSAPPRRCTLVANFQRQLVDYLRRGWVSSAYVPQHFARTDSMQFNVVDTGPLIPNAFSALLLKDAPNPDLAKSFFDFVKSEKTKEILGELRFLP